MDFPHLLMIFVRIVEQGTFSSAARSYGNSPSAVSKQMRRPEDRLGVRLLNRWTRHFTLTDEGRVFHECARSIAADLAEVEEVVASMGSKVRGILRVTGAFIEFLTERLVALRDLR